MSDITYLNVLRNRARQVLKTHRGWLIVVDKKAMARDIITLADELAAVRELHRPFLPLDDPYADHRCSSCIAGYDPRTGRLVHCVYPCPTIRIIAENGR